MGNFPAMRYSVLDLCPVAEGKTPKDAFQNSVALARLAEELGYHRYWLAEHHNMPGIASAATSVVIGHVAAHTSSIRVGSGGVMLPNHAPLVIAEQFGTLASLFPDRIDLGLGRAPGTDQTTAYALRRSMTTDPDQFPQDVAELLHYFAPAAEGQKVRAVPGEGLRVPIWILGSSTFGARLAAQMGLPYAFASHFAPAELHRAIQVYRNNFQSSEHLAEPYLMLGFTVIAADTDKAAETIATSTMQNYVNLIHGRPGRLPPPQSGYYDQLGPRERAGLGQMMACSAIGAPDTVREKLGLFIESTQPDEIIFTGNTYEHGDRLRSYSLLAEVLKTL